MGGDGGVIASNRRYMRGAGTADHTGDYGNNGSGESKQEKQQQEQRDLVEQITTCALTKVPLFNNDDKAKSKQVQPIVACPYGRLYTKEAAVQALLQRRKDEDEDNDNNGTEEGPKLGHHIRGLKDLFEVQFHYNDDNRPSCPITGDVFDNGQTPAILLVSRKKKKKKTSGGSEDSDKPNVISQRALKEMGNEELQIEYGPFDYEIRLAPPLSMMEQVKEQWNKELLSKETSKKEKKSSSSSKKRKLQTDPQNPSSLKKSSKVKTQNGSGDTNNHHNQTMAEAARKRVETAVKSNQVLSSIFR